MYQYKYTIGGNVGYVNPTSATPGSDGKSVYLVFNFDNIAGISDLSSATNTMLIGQLKDSSGNSMTAMNTELDKSAADTIGLDTSITDNVVATSTTTIDVYLNDLLNSLDASDIEVDPDGTAGVKTWTNISSLTTDNSSGKSVLTITLASANAMDSQDISDSAPLEL
jgi:hypothetical protein